MAANRDATVGRNNALMLRACGVPVRAAGVRGVHGWSDHSRTKLGSKPGRPGSGVGWIITGWAAGFRLGEDWVRKPEPNIARDRSPTAVWLGWTGNHPILSM